MTRRPSWSASTKPRALSSLKPLVGSPIFIFEPAHGRQAEEDWAG